MARMAHALRLPCDETAITHGADAADCTASQKRGVLIAAILGSSMAFIDGTVVNVALPAIQADLHATAFQAQWVVESYALFLAALLLVGGALGDHYGRRRVFAAGVALFALASLGCALAQDVHQLIAARGVQGIGGALLVPGSLALISAAFPEKERGAAIGTWSGASGITAAIGPLAGGWLVDHYSWIWAFLVNLPLAALILWVVWRRVPESRGGAASAGLDIGGASLATLGLGGIVYAFIEAPTQGWHAAPVWLAMVLGIAASVAFVAWEMRAKTPMLPLHLFRIRDFAGANLLTLALYAALGGGLFFLPLTLIQVQHYSATAAGAALLPFILIMFAFSRAAGKLVDRFGARLPLVVGPLVAGLGFALFMLPSAGTGYWLGYFPAVVVLGIGMTITVAPLTTTVMNAVGAELAGVASGVNNAVSRAASVLAVAVFGLVMAWAFNASLDAALAAMNAPADVLTFLAGQRSKLAGAQLPPGVDGSMAAALRAAIDSAFVSGFRWIMGVSAVLALASALAAWLVIGGKSPAAPTRN
jgi:EmrB/QacA subfamily drug resistance transporter